MRTHLPDLETRNSDLQKDIWQLSSELMKLQPQKASIEAMEEHRREDLSIVAEFNKERLTKHEARKQAILERIKAEQQTNEEQERLKEEKLMQDQAAAERRALAHILEVHFVKLKQTLILLF